MIHVLSTRGRSALGLCVLAVALVAGGCSGDDDSDSSSSASTTVPVPKGFDLPQGVTLTKGGTVLATGKPASVVYEPGDKATSAVTVNVKAVRKGAIKDFAFFSLDAKSKASTPYYVDVSVRNDGPAGLGGAALPLFAHDSANTIFPPNELVGTFRPCRNQTVPSSFLPGASASLCLVFLVPKGTTLQTVDLQTGSSQDAIRWKP